MPDYFFLFLNNSFMGAGRRIGKGGVGEYLLVLGKEISLINAILRKNRVLWERHFA